MTTPADLITGKICRGACLAAGTDTRRCRCQCHGELHGLLQTVDITALVDRRRWRRLSDLEVLAAAR